MSIDYYLFCDEHREAVFITSTTHSQPDPDELREFLFNHKLKETCDVSMIDEFELPDGVNIIGEWWSRDN